MSKQRRFARTSATLLLSGGLALSGGGPAAAGGFGFFPQGSKAMGMAGAFVAQADDPTAVYYNLGGLVLAPDDKKAAVGVTTFTLNESLYQGLPPGIGANTTGAQEEVMALQPHAYVALTLGPDTRVGVGVSSPFLLETEWAAPDAFAGRTVTTAAELVVYDLVAGLSQRLSPALGVGIGVVYRGSELTHARRLQRVNPFTGEAQDVGSIGVESDFSDGVGWTVGVKHQPSGRFSWGLAYRSAIEIDYLAVGRVTQIPTGNDQFDDLLGATLPFDQDLSVATAIEFPEVVSLGLCIGLGPSWALELDAELTGWSGFQELDLAFQTEPDLGIAIHQDFDDAMTLRAGVQYTVSSGIELRAGVALDESPQPEANVGPLFVDGDRTLFAFGFGKDWLDLAFVWIDVDQRIVVDQVDGLNGNYRSSAWMLGATLNM